MSTFYLEINGVKQTCGEYGVKSIDLDKVNTAISTMQVGFKVSGLNADETMSYGQTVKLWQDDTCRFVGSVTTTPRNVLVGRKEARSATVSDVLFDLDNDQYQQDWHYDASNTSYTGRVQLGRNVNNVKVDIGTAIKDVLDHAISEGISFSYVQADLDALTTIPPDDERVDITWFEAIKALLRWAPDVAVAVEYSTGSPVIRFVGRGSASAVDIASEGLRGLVVSPRNDLQINGCICKFESTNVVDGYQYVSTSEQTAGATTGRKVLKQTISLAGLSASESYQTAKVITQTPDSTSTDWWKEKVPGLSEVTDLTISNGLNPIDLGSYPRELLSGSVPSWTGKDTVEAQFSATFSGTLNGETYTDEPIYARVVLTDAFTNTYKRLSSWSYRPAEAAPAGLAQAIYDARKTLHYQGSAEFPVIRLADIGVNVWDDSNSWDDTEAWEDGSAADPFAITPINTINLTAPAGSVWNDSGSWDDASTWEDGATGVTGLDAINAVVERVSVHIERTYATRTITFSPPRHLGIDDYIDLAKATRNIRTLSWNRSGTDQEDNDAVDASGGTPNTNGGTLGSGGGGGLPDGDEGDMIIKGSEAWEALHPTTDCIIRGSSAGFEILPKPTTAGGVLIYDKAAGDVAFVESSLTYPCILVSQTDGSVDLVQLTNNKELFYHDGSGGITKLSIPATGATNHLVQVSSTGDLEIDELKAT